VVSFPVIFPPITYKRSSPLPGPYSCYVPDPPHPPWLYHSDYTWWRVYKTRSSSLCNFLNPPITAPCSQIPSNYISPLPLEITVLFIPFLYITVGYGLNDSKHYQNSICPSFPPESNFDLLLPFPNIWTLTHFQTFYLLFYVQILICIQVMR
jgi:hypothetical protein